MDGGGGGGGGQVPLDVEDFCFPTMYLYDFSPPHGLLITPRRACAARDKVIALCLESMSAKFFESFKILIHFNTRRLLFKFNGFQYSLAAREVFVAFINSDSVVFG